MKDQKVVVIGGLSGIGLAVARQAAAAGARVIAAGRRTVATDWPSGIEARQLDVEDEASVQRFFADRCPMRSARRRWSTWAPASRLAGSDRPMTWPRLT